MPVLRVKLHSPGMSLYGARSRSIYETYYSRFVKVHALVSLRGNAGLHSY